MNRLICLLMLMLAAGQGRAQSYSFSDAAYGTAIIGPVMQLQVVNLVNGASINSIADFQNGVSVQNFANVQVKSNVPWTLTVAAQLPAFTLLSSGGSTGMLSGILSLRKSGTSSFQPVSITGHQLATGSRGGFAAPGNSFNMDMHFNPGFLYRGGHYSLNLVYTLTEQ